MARTPDRLRPLGQGAYIGAGRRDRASHDHERKDQDAGRNLYRPDDAEIQADLAATAEWLARYNAPAASTPGQRWRLLAERFSGVGEGADIRPPFFCDFGVNIYLGTKVFLNFNCVLLDVVTITIGDGTQIGPAVQMYTADHPRDAAPRRAGLEFGRPVTIGKNVWIGGGAIILPGITIGDDAVIGAGSVITRDVLPGVTVGGNPARPLTPSDKPGGSAFRDR